ncbi:anti-repressor SinI family protein [Bacillus timonensis]|nr:anti-repressor SinI family protein [Bacillus timonensis]
MIGKIKNTMSLDPEWIKLLIEAKNLGLSIDDVQAFFHGKLNTMKKRPI